MPEDLENITAAILAGGLGTRLRSVVADRPKVLAQVRGRPFLSYLLDQLESSGLKSVVLCTGYMGGLVQAEFGSSYRSLALTYSQELNPLGTAGALRLALPLVFSEIVLVMNGDSFCETNLETFWTWRSTSGAVATILLTEVADTRRYGRVRVDAEGRVLKFEEKNSDSGPGWINAGVYLLKRQLLGTIQANCPVSLEKEIFPTWIGKGLYGYQCHGRFLDIGTPDSFALAHDFLAAVS
jgi:NDP-sugar pyrophosphorylase family protein